MVSSINQIVKILRRIFWGKSIFRLQLISNGPQDALGLPVRLGIYKDLLIFLMWKIPMSRTATLSVNWVFLPWLKQYVYAFCALMLSFCSFNSTVWWRLGSGLRASAQEGIYGLFFPPWTVKILSSPVL